MEGQEKSIIYIQTAEVSPLTGNIAIKIVPIEAEVIELFGDWLLAKTQNKAVLFPMQVVLRVDNPIFPVVEEEPETQEVKNE